MWQFIIDHRREPLWTRFLLVIIHQASLATGHHQHYGYQESSYISSFIILRSCWLSCVLPQSLKPFRIHGESRAVARWCSSALLSSAVGETQWQDFSLQKLLKTWEFRSGSAVVCNSGQPQSTMIFTNHRSDPFPQTHIWFIQKLRSLLGDFPAISVLSAIGYVFGGNEKTFVKTCIRTHLKFGKSSITKETRIKKQSFNQTPFWFSTLSLILYQNLF